MYYKQRLTAQTAAHTWGYSLQNFFTLVLANAKKNKTAEIFLKISKNTALPDRT